jgi:hypothetical protein
VTVVALAGSLAIPHDRYIRWQDMHAEAWARLGWMYERIHFDPTPIDIAFIGTSHSMNGIDGGAVRAALAEAGGGCRDVVNFGFPSYGRNLHWLIARELLENRKVGTLVLEVFENESRKAHPFFGNIADVPDILQAPALINLNYLSDIAKLPARQFMLGLKTLMPERFGLRRAFDPAHYDGADVDNTRQVQVGGVVLTPLRDRILPRAQLERAAARLRAEVDGIAGDGPITLEHTKHLSFTRNVFREGMRLYPPITFIPRVAQQDTEIAGHRVRRGTMVMIAPWLVHRSPWNWRDADRFDPDRFTRDGDVTPGSYIPFGLGPRICVGAAFATIESTLILASLTQRYDITPEPNQTIRPVARLTTKPAQEILCRIQKRRPTNK